MSGVDTEARGQSGLDRLVLFVAAVVVFLVVLPVALGFVGVDLQSEDRGAGGDGGQAAATPGRLQVLSVSGGAVGPDRSSVGTLTVVVTAADGPVDVSGLTATLVAEETSYLVPAGEEAGNADGVFRLDAPDGPLSPGERAVMTVDVGSDDVDGLPEVGQRLAAGTNATLVLGTSSGTWEVQISVPDTLPTDGDVPL